MVVYREGSRAWRRFSPAMRLALPGLLLLVSLAPSGAQESAKKNTFKVPDRLNKALDERIARMRAVQIEADCKAEAKKQFPDIHWKQRRAFVEDCIAQAER